MAVFSALFDSNVLYSIPVTDIVLELASTGLYRARWSDDIHKEWTQSVQADRPDLSLEVILRRQEQMDRALPQALVTGYEGIVEGLELPDPDDRHVLAAAIVGRCDVIVTFNLSHFPEEALAPYGIEAQHPDTFLNHQRSLNEPLFLACIKTIRARLSKPRYDADAYIDRLRKCQLPLLASELEKVRALI